MADPTAVTDRPDTHGMRCGLVAVVGRPNVGKSTLVNRVLGRKLSIISRKPQTTRHRILGIKNAASAQIVLVDTPGIHAGHRRALNRYMNRAADHALEGVDLALMLVEPMRWTGEDDTVLEKVRDAGAPALLVVNKVDRVTDKSRLLPYLDTLRQRGDFAEIVPISALGGDGVDRLERLIIERLPPGERLFPSGMTTDRDHRFRAAEIIREKLINQLGDELPHQLGVEIERFERLGRIQHVGAVIWVERSSQKPIVVGRGGEGLKRVGIAARRELAGLLRTRVHLEMFVKVGARWTDDERALDRLGYTD